MKTMPNIHPGEVLLEEFLTPMGNGSLMLIAVPLIIGTSGSLQGERNG